MDSEAEFRPLKIVFLPFPTPGHMIPMVDLAKIIATFNGVNCTIITTPANAALFKHSVSGKRIVTHIIDFPAAAVGLPVGIENYGFVTSPDMRPKVYRALFMLENPTKDAIRQLSPDCIISDMSYPWSSDFAAEIGVPRFVFQSASIFSVCCTHTVKAHAPHQRVDSDAGVVSLPGLPQEISMLKSQLPEWEIGQHPLTPFRHMIKEAEMKSHGIVANTLQEMEGEYVDHYSSVSGLKVWPVGPVSLWAGYGDDEAIKAQRGRNHGGDTSWTECSEWLSQKSAQSVLYVTFGSLTQFPAQQLKEIAAGLEESGHNFLWVVRRDKEETTNDDEWLPEGFRERMRLKKQGFIIEDWAPQLSILGHPSTGGMVTHCGWNSILEGVNAGMPLVTWPLFAEQFYNERLVVDVLKVGVAVGVTMWCNIDEVGLKEVVRKEKVAAAVMAVMGDGEGPDRMRQRAVELKEAAKRAVENEGGSSRVNMVAFIEELRAKTISK